MERQEGFREFEDKIGYRYRDRGLLELAFTHSSYINDRHLPKTDSNERLEFLGDAVLELISSDFLFHRNEQMPEGDLSRLRASIVCEPTLADAARQLELGRYLILGRGEEMSGGRELDSILSDALEAVIGSIYLDGGYAEAREFVLRFVLNDLEHKKLFFDSKTVLQEIVQKQSGERVTYRLIGESGPEHSKVFTAQAVIGDRLMECGSGRSKKAAEQAAAYRTITVLKKTGYESD